MINDELGAGRPVVFVVGPTASGKSSLALEWAKQSGGDILNADSVQVYGDLNIGTAKPSETDFRVAPHHLFNLVAGGETFNAGDYRREALACLARLQAPMYPSGRSVSPLAPIFVVGGSGFYVQALLRGMFSTAPARPEVQAVLRERMDREGPHVLHAELGRKDPAAAAALHVNDRYRIQRALEILETTGRPPSEIKKEFQTTPFPYPFALVGLACGRDVLRARVEDRTRAMLRAGLVDEVRALVGRGLEGWAPLQSVGYRETLDYLSGRVSMDELAPLISTHTLQLAKRQLTWFRRDSAIHWQDPTSPRHWSEAFHQHGRI